MKGFIYIIRSHQTDDVYYGSTTQMLCKRMSGHRADYKKWKYGTTNYISSYNILKYDDAYIELVEEVEFQNKQELFTREGHHIRENKCVNKLVAGRLTQEYQKQYYIDNKVKLLEKQKQYHEDNKEIAIEYQKQYREDNKDKIKEQQKQIYQNNKVKRLEKQKQYVEANKDKIKEYKKQYREANKDKINEKQRQKRAESN